MAYTDYLDTVQKVYMGYYFRPADPQGLLYWAARLDGVNGNLDEIIEAFADSAESQTLHGTINGASIGDVVDDIYMALFNRTPDAGGKDFYVNGFNAGTFTAATIMLNILDGATGLDAVAVENKLAAANLFTTTIDPELDGKNPQATYAGDADAQAGRDFLAPVTFDPSTLPNQAETKEFLQENIADEGDPLFDAPTGESFTLTTGQDDILGTSGDDAIYGYVNYAVEYGQTLNSGDVINGGLGNDTLSVTVDYYSDTDLYVNMSDVETLSVRDFDGESFYLNNVVDLQNIVWTKSSEYTYFEGLNNVVDVEMVKPIDWGEYVDLYYGLGIGNAGTLTQKVLLDSTEYNGNYQYFYAYDYNGNYFGTYDITSQGEKNSLYLYTDSGTTTLNIAGATDLDLIVSDVSGINTVNAGDMTGSLDVDLQSSAAGLAVTTGAGNDYIAVTGANVASVSMGDGNDHLDVYTSALGATATVDLGAGDDSVYLAVAPTAGVTLTGGEGTDTLSITSGIFADFSNTAIYSAANLAKITGFEVLSISDTLPAGSTFDLSKIAGLNSFIAENGVTTASTATVSNVLSGNSVTLAGDLVTNNGTLDIQVKDAATGTADVLNLNIFSSAAGATATILAADVETINLDVTGNDATLALTDAALTALNIAGANKVVFAADATMTTLATVDASANTAGVFVDVNLLGQGVSVTGTTVADTIAVGDFATVTGNGGNDTFLVYTPTSGQTYSTVLDANAGDTIDFQFADISAFNATKISLAGTAVFQDYLDAATAGAGGATSAWFQWNGNTYVAQDNSGDATFANDLDVVVELAGQIDLATASLVTGNLVLA